MGDSVKDIFGSGDVFGGGNLFGGRDLLSGGRQPPPAPKFPELGPAEAGPEKEGLLHKAVSGLNYAGSTLDKLFGARAIRGVAAGKWHEALSAIPGSDTLGLTKPDDAVSMDDLLTKHYHVFKPNDPNRWEVRDFAVPILEAAADPGSYINPFGAATKAGKIATGLGHTRGWTRKALTEGFTHSESALKAAGMGADEVAHFIRQGNRVLPESLQQAATAAGRTLDVGTPLRGSLGFGLPFKDAAGAVGTGARSQAIAGVMDDLAGGFERLPGVRHAAALFDPEKMRATDPGVQQAAKLAGRPAAEAAGAATRYHESVLRTELDDLMKNYRSAPGLENEALRVIRAHVEDATPLHTDPHHWAQDLRRRAATVVDPATGRTLATGVTDPDPIIKHIHANWNQLRDMGLRVRGFGEDTLKGAQHGGLWDELLNDEYAHYGARRYIFASPGYGGKDAARQFPTVHGSNMRRKSPLRDIPGGSEQLNEWAMNPALSGAARTQTHAQVVADVYADMERHILAGYPPPFGSPHTPTVAAEIAEKLKSAQGKANEVAHWLAGVPADHAAQGIPYFNPDVVADLAMRGQRHAKVSGSAAALIHGAVDMSRPANEVEPNGRVLLGDFLNKKGRAGLRTDIRPVQLTDDELRAVMNAGFKNSDHLRNVASDPSIASPAEVAALASLNASHPALAAKAQSDEWYGAANRAYEQMARKGFPQITDTSVGKFNPIGELNEHALTGDQADVLARFLQGYVQPTETKPFLNSLAGAQTFFKNMVYPLWPASHAKNAVGIGVNNYLDGTRLRHYGDARRLMFGNGEVDPARYAITHGMTPAQAGAELRHRAYADGKVFGGITSFEDHVGGRGPQDGRFLGGLMGENRLTPSAPGVHEPVRDIIGRAGKNALNPLAQQGLFGHTEDAFAPLVAGRRAGTTVENFGRLANYLGNLEKGLGSSQAGARTRAVHFDYTDMTPFERNVMKPLVPFYTFMRKNLPYQAKMALAEPNKVSPLMHAMGTTDPTGEWKPEYLQSGAAVPLGGEQDGTRRFLAKFGLPVEEAFDRLKFRNYQTPWGQTMNLPSASQTGMAFLGSMSPYIKGPLEYLTDTQFHTGRDLSDLYPKGVAGGYGVLPAEIAQPLTQLVANSPLARVASSIDQLAQVPMGRKDLLTAGVNLLSGAKITDVDMEKQRAIVARKELEAMFKGDPRVAKFTNFYVKQGMEDQVDPELLKRMRLFTTMKKDAKAYHKGQQAKVEPKWGGL